MRVLAALAAAVFTYLALIPAGLIYSTLDSACAGEACSTSLLSRIAFTALYAACLLALLATAVLLADYARRGTIEAQERIPPALAACGAVFGIAVFVLFIVAFPLGGLVALLLAAAGYGLARRSQARGRETTDPPGPTPAVEFRGNGTGSGQNGSGDNGRPTLGGAHR